MLRRAFSGARSNRCAPSTTCAGASSSPAATSSTTRAATSPQRSRTIPTTAAPAPPCSGPTSNCQPSATAPRPLAARTERSIRVLPYLTPEDREPKDLEVQPRAPVPDVIQVVLDAVHHLAQGVGLAAPAIDLRPACDAGLDLVP